MNFSTPKQTAVMVIVWTALLFASDWLLNPERSVFGSERSPVEQHFSRPQLRIWMNHMCCSGCLSDVESALEPFPWLGRPLLADEKALLGVEDADLALAATSEFRQRVDIDVLDVNGVDFIAVVNAIRSAGFAVQHIEFGGISHYRLEAELDHMCCNLCVLGAREGMEELVATTLPRGYFGWLDSFSISKVNKIMTFYPRFDEPVDIMDILVGINRLGFSPSSMTIQVDGQN